MLPDKAQRLIIYNQYEILKILDPKNKAHYEENQDVVSYGFETAFEWMTDFIYDTISKTTCTEVLDALSVCEAMDISQQNGGFKSGEFWSTFQGFDGNNETEHLVFARFLVQKQQKFTTYASHSFNSHMASVSKYNRMHAKWVTLQYRHDLSLEEVDSIAKA